MRRSSAEIRRAIQFERREADESRADKFRLITIRELHDAVADALQWAHGDPGTTYELLTKERNKADLVKLPAMRPFRRAIRS